MRLNKSMQTHINHKEASPYGIKILHLALILYTVLFIGVAKEASANISSNVDSIETKIMDLKAQLEDLPELTLSPTPWTLGYRSDLNRSKEEEIQINLKFITPGLIDLIALMPTSYTKHSGSIEAFGFPERFTIETLQKDGPSELIVDYSHEDYSATGIEPQLFHLLKPIYAEGIQIKILRQAPNPTWWDGNYISTLSEVYAFSGKWNLALNAKVNTSSKAIYGNVWNPQCLVDGFCIFNPIKGNLNSPFTEFYYQNDELSLLFDLGANYEVDEIRLWPVAHSAQHNFPLSSGIGFPTKILLEKLEDPNQIVKTDKVYQTDSHFPRPGSGPLLIRFKEVSGRYFKLTINNPVAEFRVNDPLRLILAEIEILEKGTVLTGKKSPKDLTLKIDKSQNYFMRLTNGSTSEGSILGQRNWIEGLSQRALLERQLKTLYLDLSFAQRQERERFRFIIGLSMSIIVILSILIWLVKLILEQRWNRVRDRIACDLHDEIGANISSLFHMTELIKETISHPTDLQKQMLDNALKTAQLTSKETRNFIQHLESDQTSFDVNDQIRKIAKQFLGVIEYECDLETTSPFKRMTASKQWDLIMFVKEALNNISKHAQARHVKILTYKEHGRTCISISDDGVGISEDNAIPRHLQDRAKRLQGELTLSKHSSAGTHILLKLKK